MSRPNVLFVVMDTARAEYAYDPDIMPNLARIAREGATFTNAFANGPWTVPSHASMFTGQCTADHDTHAGTKRFDPDVPALAEALGDDGYRTACFSNNTWVSPDFGFDRGFEEFVAGWELLGGGADLPTIGAEHEGTRERLRAVFDELGVRNSPKTLLNAAYAKFLRKRYDNGAALTNWRLRRWLPDACESDRPFFAFVNYLEPHLPYDPPGRDWQRFLPSDLDPKYAAGVNQNAHRFITGNAEMTARDFAALEALYKGELSYLDRRIGRLYEVLAENGALTDTVLLVVGDHGENLGDHRLMDHQYNLYDTVLRVPLVVRYPGSFPASETRTGLVELRDLYPTILSVAGIRPPDDESVSRRSIAGGGGREHVVAEYAAPQPSIDSLAGRFDDVPADVRQYDRALWSVRTDEWKYIEGTDGSAELYRVATDSDEREDLADEQPDVRAELTEVLSGTRAELAYRSTAAVGDVDAGAQRRLKDLGYL